MLVTFFFILYYKNDITFKSAINQIRYLSLSLDEYFCFLDSTVGSTTSKNPHNDRGKCCPPLSVPIRNILTSLSCAITENSHDLSNLPYFQLTEKHIWPFKATVTPKNARRRQVSSVSCWWFTCMCVTCLFAGTTFSPESVDFLKGLCLTVFADSARLLISLRRR